MFDFQASGPIPYDFLEENTSLRPSPSLSESELLFHTIHAKNVQPCRKRWSSYFPSFSQIRWWSFGKTRWPQFSPYHLLWRRQFFVELVLWWARGHLTRSPGVAEVLQRMYFNCGNFRLGEKLRNHFLQWKFEFSSRVPGQDEFLIVTWTRQCYRWIGGDSWSFQQDESTEGYSDSRFEKSGIMAVNPRGVKISNRRQKGPHVACSRSSVLTGIPNTSRVSIR